MAEEQKPSGPDLTEGLDAGQLADGQMLLGHVGGEPVLLARSGSDYFAIGPSCTHYHGPLNEGLIVGQTVRCPWHHACFDLRTGEAVRAPALDPVPCWQVEQRDGKVFVRGKRGEQKPRAGKAPAASPPPGKVVIVGGGAAGVAAAEMMRRHGFQGSITMLSSDDAPPVDRPNLSKDYLAGTAPEDWLPLRAENFYAEQNIDLRLNSAVVNIDARQKKVALANGGELAFDRLLLATGAEPVKLTIAGADLPHVHVLRTLADSRRLIEAANAAKRAVVIGASFIGLEVAASLRKRNVEVHVISPEKIPMERVLGPQLGSFVKKLHEENGVVFHLEDTATTIATKKVSLKGGTNLDADFVCVGIGVRPRLTLAEQLGLALDRGVLVDECMETSVPGIFAAGDIARWPDRHSGEKIRVEHWVVAERQGQAAALNMLGDRAVYDSAPFFWSQHYDIPINYVGHAEKWDAIEVEGDIDGKDCLLRYKRNGRVLAVSSIFRDVANLQAEVAMESGMRSA